MFSKPVSNGIMSSTPLSSPLPSPASPPVLTLGDSDDEADFMAQPEPSVRKRARRPPPLSKEILEIAKYYELPSPPLATRSPSSQSSPSLSPPLPSKKRKKRVESLRDVLRRFDYQTLKDRNASFARVWSIDKVAKLNCGASCDGLDASTDDGKCHMANAFVQCRECGGLFLGHVGDKYCAYPSCRPHKAEMPTTPPRVMSD